MSGEGGGGHRKEARITASILVVRRGSGSSQTRVDADHMAMDFARMQQIYNIDPWGGQSCLQPPFEAASRHARKMSGSVGRKSSVVPLLPPSNSNSNECSRPV